VLSIAWLLYGLSYAGFGLASHWATAWLWLALYALHYGLAEGGQRALLAEYVPGNARGRAYGYQLAIEGLMVLPANVLFGFIYERFGGELAFLCGGGIAMLAAAFLFWLVPAPEKRSARPEASAP
jgi:MFS family permease